MGTKKYPSPQNKNKKHTPVAGLSKVYTPKYRGEGGVSACMRASGCSDDTSDGYCGRRNTEYPALSNSLSLGDDARLEDFMYIIITRVPGDDNYRKRFSLCLRFSLGRYVSYYVCDDCRLLILFLPPPLPCIPPPPPPFNGVACLTYCRELCRSNYGLTVTVAVH